MYYLHKCPVIMPLRKLKKLPRIISDKFRISFNFILFKISKNWVLLDRINRRIKPAIWRLAGSKVGKNVSIGYDVYFDVHNASLITIEDNVWIASRTTIFCHKRIMTEFYKGDVYNDLPYKKLPVILKKGCVIGIGSTIMPGVTVGEGAIIGVGSLVVNDIPEWTIAVGNPAKVVKHIPERP